MKIIGLSVVYWVDEWFIQAVDSVIDFVDDIIIWHNKYPYLTSSLQHDPDQHEKVKMIVDVLKEKYGEKIKYHLNEKEYTSENITNLINNEILFHEYDVNDFIMYIDSDEIFIPDQLKKIKKLVVQNDKYHQYKIFQRHYIKYDNLWMPCPTNPHQTFLTRNLHLNSYIRNHKDVKTFIFPKDKLYYKHMAYCPKDWNHLKTKLIGQLGCESGITIETDWYENVFMKINQDNYSEFKDFSYIKEFPNHMPFIVKEIKNEK